MQLLITLSSEKESYFLHMLQVEAKRATSVKSYFTGLLARTFGWIFPTHPKPGLHLSPKRQLLSPKHSGNKSNILSCTFPLVETVISHSSKESQLESPQRRKIRRQQMGFIYAKSSFPKKKRSLIVQNSTKTTDT